MTIKVTALSGPYAGQTKEAPPEITAEGLLGGFLERGWQWSIDYSRATEEEAYE
ncbi:MAG: hypothetical protein KBD19_03145 [Candidatus Moranbacteria bacterium]|nr:hypothetical protein [Candidatus Moranbacteria bacterium]